MKNYAKSASRLHRKIGEILSTTSPWKGLKCEQEVLVKSLFPSFSGTSERYDWVIKDLFTIIEAHGKQHYSLETFGAEVGTAIMNFQEQQSRDKKKEEIAHLHKWTYLIIPYTDEKKLDSEYLFNLYNANKYNIAPIEPKPNKKVEFNSSRKSRLAAAKEYRRKQYEYQKQYKRKLNKKD